MTETLHNARLLILFCVNFSGGKLVDAGPEVERERQQELEKLAKQYGGGAGVDMTQFPQFKFTGEMR